MKTSRRAVLLETVSLERFTTGCFSMSFIFYLDKISRGKVTEDLINPEPEIIFNKIEIIY